MDEQGRSSCTVFEGTRRIASGRPIDVALAARAATGLVLIFDDATGEQVELDLRGSPEEVLARLGPETPAAGGSPRGPGRPRLGVVAREVTLLPRHWEWLNGQPGGASVALRRLVEEASRAKVGMDRARRARDAAYRFLSAIAGNLPGFEEAIRALFAGNLEAFRRSTEGWPADVRDHAIEMTGPALRDP